MSTEAGRAPTPTVRPFHFLFVQFAFFGFLLLFPLSLTFLLPVFFFYFFCFANCFSCSFFCFASLWPFRREHVLQNRGGMERRAHSSSFSFLSRSCFYQTAIFRLKKQSVRTRWPNVNILEIQFKIYFILFTFCRTRTLRSNTSQNWETKKLIWRYFAISFCCNAIYATDKMVYF